MTKDTKQAISDRKSPDSFPPERTESNGQEGQDLEQALQELRRDYERLQSGYASLTRRLIGLRMLQHIAQDLVSELDVDQLLKRILRSAIHAVEGVAGSLLLLEGKELVFAVVEGGGGEALQGQRMPRDQGLAGWVVSHNQPLIISDVQEDERFYERIPNGVHFEVKSQICVPLVARGQIVGVVQILNKAYGAEFTDDDLDLLTSFAAQSATAIENLRLYQNLKRERDRLIAVEEEVRRRLARDLHDGPAQLLVAIIGNLEFIQLLMERDPDKVPQEVESLIPTAQKALRQVRTLLFDLRPVILETQGLVPALESYVQQQREPTGPSYHLQVNDFSGRLAAPAEQTIFSIVQEAVGNVRKHARAQNLWIVVAEQDDQLVVAVQDDGQGFDVDELDAEYDQRGSLGMLNMQERAEEIGGTLSVRSEPGVGTSIILSVPLEPLRQGNG